ncbi:unnamed protein product [Protopolystoma xenopodis]|uniref:Secreted protein n=1 Tax=Protopolystoma xenopodis TaxID=117903 RepID=A0A448WHZ8_9PLAT|nr:unnamed protein product [Protopolystoma xenopodis]
MAIACLYSTCLLHWAEVKAAVPCLHHPVRQCRPNDSDFMPYFAWQSSHVPTSMAATMPSFSLCFVLSHFIPSNVRPGQLDTTEL